MRKGPGDGQLLSISQPGALQGFPINNFWLHLTLHSQLPPSRAPSGWPAVGQILHKPSPVVAQGGHTPP